MCFTPIIQNPKSQIQNSANDPIARTSTFGGIVRPICLAAFRLTMKSNLIGCSIGKVGGHSAFENLIHIGRGAAVQVRDRRAVGHQPAFLDKLSGRIDSPASGALIASSTIRFELRVTSGDKIMSDRLVAGLGHRLERVGRYHRPTLYSSGLQDARTKLWRRFSLSFNWYPASRSRGLHSSRDGTLLREGSL